MGVEFYITRAEFWAENEGQDITIEEWQVIVNSDEELKLDTKNGEFFALWTGTSAYDAPWLDWESGNIYTKWPDTGLYRKMLEIALKLNARVMDDNGIVYSQVSEWEYEPKNV